MRLKIGDVVMLKSGGPPMTITTPIQGSRNAFYCTWFDASGTAKDKEFPEDALVLYSETTKTKI